VVGLVDCGHGKLKAVYVKMMIATLRAHDVLVLSGGSNDDMVD